MVWSCLCCALIASWLMMDYGSRDAIWVTKEIQHGIEEEQQAINLKKDKCLYSFQVPEGLAVLMLQ